jgi:hypothetical protein
MERPRPFATTDRTIRVPEPVRHAVLKSLAKDRGARYANAAEFAAALRALRADLVREAGEESAARDLADSRALFTAARREGSEKAGPVSVEDLVASGLVPLPPEPPRQAVPPDGFEEATVRLSSVAKAAAETGGGAGPKRGRAGLALAGSVVFLAAALAVWLATRPAAPPPASPSGARGTLVLNASPWGRVISVVEETTGAAVDAGAAVTPCRLPLPAGRWRVVVRGADGAEATATAVVREGADSVVHLDLPGFDVETAVRSFVPNGT